MYRQNHGFSKNWSVGLRETKLFTFLMSCSLVVKQWPFKGFCPCGLRKSRNRKERPQKLKPVDNAASQTGTNRAACFQIQFDRVNWAIFLPEAVFRRIGWPFPGYCLQGIQKLTCRASTSVPEQSTRIGWGCFLWIGMMGAGLNPGAATQVWYRNTKLLLPNLREVFLCSLWSGCPKGFCYMLNVNPAVL